jgi:hypothetical protein
LKDEIEKKINFTKGFKKTYQLKDYGSKLKYKINFIFN